MFICYEVQVIAASILILMGAFFQSTVLEHIEILNIRPNLLIVLMVIVSLLRPGGKCGYGCYLADIDVLMGKPWGWYALLFFLFQYPFH